MQKYGYELAVLSIVNMWRETVITKEEFDIEYGIKDDEEIEMLDREDISVGEDLETFIRRIKNCQVNETTVPDNGDRNGVRLLCLLDVEERRKLEAEDPDYIRTFESGDISGIADDPDTETEYKDLKFAMSQAWRRTFIIDAKARTIDGYDEAEDKQSVKYPDLSNVEQFRLF